VNCSVSVTGEGIGAMFKENREASWKRRRRIRGEVGGGLDVKD